MFEITKADDVRVEIATKQVKVVFDVAEMKIDAGLEVGEIQGPGEFEIGDMTIRGVAVKEDNNGGGVVDVADAGADSVAGAVAMARGERTIYDVEIGGVHVGIIGGCEDGLDDLGMADILCTNSVRVVREIEPKLVVAMGNIDGMVTDLKLVARTEKKLKVKSADALPATLEVVAIN